MVKTKGVERAVSNWKGAAAVVPGRYSEGVGQARDVIAKSIEADDLWKERIAAAMARDARKKGLAEVSDEEWRRKALDKGAKRIGPGMAAAESDFRKGIGEVISVIEGVSLPPRTGDVTANIMNRVVPIATALRAMKER